MYDKEAHRKLVESLDYQSGYMDGLHGAKDLMVRHTATRVLGEAYQMGYRDGQGDMEDNA
jgi:hypothetical protein